MVTTISQNDFVQLKKEFWEGSGSDMNFEFQQKPIQRILEMKVQNRQVSI